MKFTIRDLFLVTVIVALGLGWGVDRRNSADERARVKQLAEEQQIIKAEIVQEKKDLRETERKLRVTWGRNLVDRTGFTPSKRLDYSAPAPNLSKP